MNMLRPFLVLCCLTACCAPSPAQTDDAIWAHFEAWVHSTPATLVRDKPAMDLYAERLAAEGIAPADAQRRIRTIAGKLRLQSRARSVVYWDAMFRFGGGPEQPLRLLDEVARNLAPGRALDVAMGNGRNSLYLASLGWDATGYDISPEGIALARRRAAALGTQYRIVEAGHREFEFGTARWDLVVLSYVVADEGDLELVFGRKLWDSLRPGGRLVCEGNFCEPLVRLLLPLKLEGMRLERYSDTEDVRDGWAADNSRGRVIRAVVWKRPE